MGEEEYFMNLWTLFGTYLHNELSKDNNLKSAIFILRLLTEELDSKVTFTLDKTKIPKLVWKMLFIFYRVLQDYIKCIKCFIVYQLVTSFRLKAPQALFGSATNSSTYRVLPV